MPPKAPVFSIVVPAYNAEATLRDCLHALTKLKIDAPHEIILVDDGSTDATPHIALEFTPAVKLLQQPHSGASAARNAGVAQAEGEIILFTDADCEPVPDWASTLVAAIQNGADGAKGTYRTRQSSLVARFVQAEYESKYRRMEGRTEIDFVDTYSAAYRREILLEAGGFVEGLPFVEDQELSFRLAESGYRLVYAPTAIVYHRHVASLTNYIRRKFGIGYWKIYVGTRHPGRMINDSHTPQSIKLQMLLVAGALAFAAVPISRLARRTSAACSMGFLASTLPFAVNAARRDPTVGAVTPFMLLLRAVALGCGLVTGLVRLFFIHVRTPGHNQVE
ncbi:MAG: glycosyltransferase [Chloroflexota bacterium]